MKSQLKHLKGISSDLLGKSKLELFNGFLKNSFILEIFNSNSGSLWRASYDICDEYFNTVMQIEGPCCIFDGIKIHYSAQFYLYFYNCEILKVHAVHVKTSSRFLDQNNKQKNIFFSILIKL